MYTYIDTDFFFCFSRMGFDMDPNPMIDPNQPFLILRDRLEDQLFFYQLMF